MGRDDVYNSTCIFQNSHVLFSHLCCLKSALLWWSPLGISAADKEESIQPNPLLLIDQPFTPATSDYMRSQGKAGAVWLFVVMIWPISRLTLKREEQQGGFNLSCPYSAQQGIKQHMTGKAQQNNRCEAREAWLHASPLLWDRVPPPHNGVTGVCMVLATQYWLQVRGDLTITAFHCIIAFVRSYSFPGIAQWVQKGMQAAQPTCTPTENKTELSANYKGGSDNSFPPVPSFHI